MSHLRYIEGALYRICDMCYIKNVGLHAVGQVYCIKRHSYSEPMHRELFNMQFNHYLHNSIGLYKFGWISMGNVRNRGKSQRGRCLHQKKLKIKKKRRGKIQEIVDIHLMSK